MYATAHHEPGSRLPQGRAHCTALVGGISSVLFCCIPAGATSFVLDPPSPSSCTGSLAACIHNEGPIEIIDLTLFGLGPNDVIDAISAGTDPIRPSHGPHDYFFSVSRNSQGRVATDVRANYPNAEGDMFIWDGTVGDNFIAPAPRGWGVQDGQEHWAGLLTSGSGDNVTGLERADFRWGPTEWQQQGWEEGDPSPPSVPFMIYFSLQAGSPALSTYGLGPADIIVVGGSYTVPTLFLSAAQLGIPSGSEIDLDALALEVGSTSVAVRYSVTSASTGFSLGGSGHTVNSGASILGSQGTGSGRIIRGPLQLGLRGVDELDALEVETSSEEATEYNGLDVLPLGSVDLSLAEPNHLMLGNLDSSGENGLWIPHAPVYAYDGGNDISDDLMLEIVGLGQQPDGAGIAVEKLSDLDGQPAHSMMTFVDDGMWIDCIVQADGWETGLLLEFLLDGELQTQTQIDTPDIMVVSLADDTAWPIGFSVDEQGGQSAAWDGPVWMEPAGGQQVLADEIRLVAVQQIAVEKIVATAVTALDIGGVVTLTDLSSSSQPGWCSGDFNNDGLVATGDLLILLADWGPNPASPSDLDDDGTVGTTDLLVVLAMWGSCGGP